MLDLPGFTPIIKLGDEATWFWDSVPHDVLIARLGEALGDEGLLKKVKAKGIHDFLNFQGKVILSTIMPDEMLDRLSKEKYVELLDAIRLDAAMILDCYTYIDDPLVVSWQQLFKSVGAVAYLADHTDIPLIGLVKGANTEQLSWCLEYLFEMNFHTLVLPRRELVRAGDVGKRLFGYVLTKIRELGYELLNLLIYGKPFLRDFIDDRKIHFASLSWYLRAEAGIVYVGDEVESLENNILYECDCEFCRGRKWNELITDVRSMALHNLAQIIDLHKGWRRQ